LEASVKKEDGIAAAIVRVGEPQDSKQEIPTASTQENIDTIENEKEADGSMRSNSSRHDVSDQEIGVINQNHVDMPPLGRQVRVCILYEFKLGNVANLAFLNVNRAFGEGTVSNAVVHRWFARFQEGDEDLDNEPTKELDINDETIEEDPAVVEALLSKQYGVPPGTLYTYLDRMGRGERLHELEPEELGLPGNPDVPRSMQTLMVKLGLPWGSQPSASLRSLIENGTVQLTPSVRENGDVKPEVPDDFPEEITVKDILTAHTKLLLPSTSTQNGHSVEYNKVRICDNGREYRNTLAGSSHKISVVIDPPSLRPPSEVQKTAPRDMSPGNEERLGYPLCGKVMLRRNVYDHLRKIHDSSEQEVESMKANIKIEANAKKDEFHIICPVCDDQFLDQEKLAIHCNEEHTHNGANGEEQDYTVHDLDFASKKDFEVQNTDLCRKHSLDYVIRRCRKDFSAKDSRMYFMTKGDLWNIINKYGLKPGYRDADDLKSIQLREAEHNVDHGIRLLEMPTSPSGEDFAMGEAKLGHYFEKDMRPIDEKVRICLLYEYRLGTTAEVATYNLNKVFGPGAISLFSAAHYYAKFHRGDMNLEAKQRGRYSTVDPEIVRAMLKRNPTLSCREIAKVFGVNGTTISRNSRMETSTVVQGEELGKLSFQPVPAEKLLIVPGPCREESCSIPKIIPTQLHEGSCADSHTEVLISISPSQTTLDRKEKAEESTSVTVTLSSSVEEFKKEDITTVECSNQEQLQLINGDDIKEHIYSLH
uniref:C2H2-type domain-containing protein n=1 Tax=Haemonchus placei TaxID=6290 RepID=A0A0N4WUC7_HAEPC